MMRRINLPCGRHTRIEEADWPIVAPYRWFAAQQSSGQVYARGETHRGAPRVYMHRLIMAATRDVLVDHWDGHGLHNERGNLRITVTLFNNQNVAKRSRRKPFKGVFQARERFYAEITAHGRRFQDRGHATAEDAARAYDRLAKLHHGEFARLNFPEASNVHGRRRTENPGLPRRRHELDQDWQQTTPCIEHVRQHAIQVMGLPVYADGRDQNPRPQAGTGDDCRPLPPGDPASWDVLLLGTCIEGMPFDGLTDAAA